MIFPFQETLSQLWRESRGNLIGGVLGVITITVATFFGKSIVGAIKRPFKHLPSPPLSLSPPVGPAEATNAVHAVSKNPIPRPPLAGFVARRDENGRDLVERLKDELAPVKEQLIALWGAGGVGKTTLAAETARAMRAVFPGGIVWTSADGKSDYSLSTLLDTIATHLGRPELRQLAPEPKADEVHNALSKASDMLIVLDNFETVSPEEQEKCAEWLANRATCPALITSRDEVRHARPIRILAMSELEAHEFLQRLISEALNPHAFEQLDHEQIIKASDRIPLVLQWLVKQIDSAKQPHVVLDELSHGEGDAAERVFDRSFELAQVGNDGRATLLALSLFVPDVSRNALANVAGFDDDEKRLDKALQQLIELWLIQLSENNERIRVQGLTRELANARLGKEKSSKDYRRRFVSYFLEYAQKHSKNEPEDYAILEAEKDNLLNAIDISFELMDWDSVRALANTVALPVNGMLSIRGYWAEALRVNQQALDAARQSSSQSGIAVFAHNLAVMHRYLGELDKSQELCKESLEIERKLGNPRGIAASLNELASLAKDRGELTEARRLYDESLEIQRRLDDQSGIAITVHQLAILAKDRGELVEARKLYDESLDIERKLDHQSGIAISLHELGTLAKVRGELAEARRLYDESLEIKRNLGNQLGLAITVNMLGELTEEEGNNKEAERLYAEALVVFERLKSPRAEGVRENLERVRAARNK